MHKKWKWSGFTMKKSFTKVLAFAMIAVMGLSGCGSDSSNQSSNDSSSATTGGNFKFATGDTTGSYYPYGGAVAQVVKDATDGAITLDVQSTGGSKTNIYLLDDGEVQLALAQNDVMSYAYTGTELFEGDPVTSLSTVATLYAEVCQIVVDPASGINSVADLKGKRVSVGDAGSGTEANARQILAAYGLSFDDITVNNLGFGDSATAMKDKKIDAFFVTAGTPTTAISELAATNEIKILSLDEDVMASLMNDYSFYTEYTIPAGSYTNYDEEVKTLTVKATLVAANSLDEETVYNITKALFDNLETLQASNAKASELSLESAVEGVSVPLHPGAEKYYKEAGVVE